EDAERFELAAGEVARVGISLADVLVAAGGDDAPAIVHGPGIIVAERKGEPGRIDRFVACADIGPYSRDAEVVLELRIEQRRVERRRETVAPAMLGLEFDAADDLVRPVDGVRHRGE